MMEFPGSLTGPRFGEGDIVTFLFEDAELTLRLPVVVYNTESIDEVSPVRDFTNAETWRWDECMEHRQKEIVVQNWKYEDEVTHDNIAAVYLSISIIAHKDIDEHGHYLLSSRAFRQFWEEASKKSYNKSVMKEIEKPLINGVHALIDPDDGVSQPTPIAFFSLGRRFSARMSFCFDSLHYSDRKNPYSDELLHNWKLDLFDDFLSYLNIAYTPETVALIKNIDDAKGVA